ncbi:MAG: hypothetical protein GX021_00295 [Tissierellia bacterium]|nr:hypothetical protein [Tissierellia bacterium]
MLIGLSFIFISIFIYVFENYDLIEEDGLKVFRKKDDLEKDRAYRYKMLVSILAFVLGIFRILNWIIY